MNKHLHGFFRLSTKMAIVVLLGSAAALAQTAQEQVHRMAHSVMPFDVAKTVHIFKMTESGGIQRVIAKDRGATEQIALIQQHLEHEAAKFAHGDYSDPAKLHGADMPGLEELKAGSSDIKVSYSPLPAGAAITFETNSLHLLTAIHRWFGAQLSEHSADAKEE